MTFLVWAIKVAWMLKFPEVPRRPPQTASTSFKTMSSGSHWAHSADRHPQKAIVPCEGQTWVWGHAWWGSDSKLCDRTTDSLSAGSAFTGEDAVGMDAGALRQEPGCRHRAGLWAELSTTQELTRHLCPRLPTPQPQGLPPLLQALLSGWVGSADCMWPCWRERLSLGRPSRLTWLWRVCVWLMAMRVLGSRLWKSDHVTLDRPPCRMHLCHANWGFHTCDFTREVLRCRGLGKSSWLTDELLWISR